MPRRRAVRAVRCHRPGALAHARADGGLDRPANSGHSRSAGGRGAKRAAAARADEQSSWPCGSGSAGGAIDARGGMLRR
eukprot:1563404-Prymnesium_polylepis.1